MQITIDSAEPLEDVLRVISSVYGVTLTSSAGDESKQATPAADRRPGRRDRAAGTARAAKRQAKSAQDENAVDAKAMRAWARENGIAVSGRGALSATVRDAYAAAN